MFIDVFPDHHNIVKYHDMNRAALINQIQEATEILDKLSTLLQSALVERDRFVTHLYQSRREYRRTCETAGKSGKQIERCVIASFRVAESMGFKGGFRQWEELLRIGDRSWLSTRSHGSAGSGNPQHASPGPPVNGKRQSGADAQKARLPHLGKTRQPPQVRYASMLNINGGWWSQPSRNQSDSDQRRGWEPLTICRVSHLSKNPTS